MSFAVFLRFLSLRMRIGGMILFFSCIGGEKAAWAGSWDWLNPLKWFAPKEALPAPQPESLPYQLNFLWAEPRPVSKSERAEVLEALKEASLLQKLLQDPPADGSALLYRIEADKRALIDALWALGYYNGEIHIQLHAEKGNITAHEEGEGAFLHTIESYRGHGFVPLDILVKPGPAFRIRELNLQNVYEVQEKTQNDDKKAKETQAERFLRHLFLKPGDVLDAQEIRKAESQLTRLYREQGHPLAKALEPHAEVDHRTQAAKITLRVDSGPRAPLDHVYLRHTDGLKQELLRSFIYLQPGEAYHPQKIEKLRQSLSQIPALGSIRITEGPGLDSEGRLPLSIDVTQRKRQALGFSARYSTIDGPAFHPYWEIRNLFGGAEWLRLEGDVFLLPRINGTKIERLKDVGTDDVGGRLALKFVKFALNGSRNDLLFDANLTRQRIGENKWGGYLAAYAYAALSFRHRFSEEWSAQGGVIVEKSHTEDILGTLSTHLTGISASTRYDSTDNWLDPTKGFRWTMTSTLYPRFLGSTLNMGEVKTEFSAYKALEETGRYVLAGRLGLGKIFTSSGEFVPAHHRFYAGGGGSVRGFAYRSLSPTWSPNPGESPKLTGGLNLFEASLEARIRLTESFAIVPFVDIGKAFGFPGSPFNDFRLANLKRDLGVSAGIGLRYLTAFGPLRLDVAMPMNRETGDQAFALYFGIGQAF